MKKERKLRISQCMIVKNEEKNIRQALSWGKELMWEQIVVDTGSTDRTVELAKELGATVYSFSWIDDFAAAKNFAIEKARGDWIAFLDADEYMDAESVERLQMLFAKISRERLLYQVIVTNWFNVDENGRVCTGGNQARFFKNRRGLRYRGRIHECLTSEDRVLGPTEVLNACDRLTIYHTGYTERSLVDGKKQERNRRLILKELEERPGDYAMMGNLADTYSSEGDYDSALEWYEKAMNAIASADLVQESLGSRTSQIFSSLLVLLCNKKKEPEQIQAVYEKAIQYVPQESDFDYIMGNYLAKREEYEKAAYHLERSLELLNTYGNLCHGILLTADLIRTQEYLATCYFNMGRRDLCVNSCVRLLQIERFAMGGLKMLLFAFQADAQVSRTAGMAAISGQQVLGFLEKLYDLSALKDRLFLLRGANETAYEELIQELRKLFSVQELIALDAVSGGTIEKGE